jgi:hypothetical protein
MGFYADVEHEEYPFEKLHADNAIVHGRGKLKNIRFGGADMYARKSIADPAMVSHSWIHHFEPPGDAVMTYATFAYLDRVERNFSSCRQ